MPRTVELIHFSDLLASLIVKAARASSPAKLAAVQAEISSAFVDVFTLISHDAGALGFTIEQAKQASAVPDDAELL